MPRRNNRASHDDRRLCPRRVAELGGAWGAWDKGKVAPLWHGGATEDPTAPPEPATPRDQPAKR